MKVLTLTLPYPPTANKYWRPWRNRMVTTPEARAYREKVAMLGKVLKVQPLEGPVSVAVDAFRPRRIGDLDNILKVSLDSLRGVAFEDDDQVVEILALRRDDAEDPRVVVRVMEAKP